jgi:hypothetical protein
MTEARAQLPTLLEQVRRGNWQLIGRRGKAEAVVADAAEVQALLASAYAFTPGVFIEEDQVGIYLEELDVHGVGATLEEAESDLLDAVLEYIDDWQDHLHAAPNHRGRAGYVRRIQLAGERAGVHRVLFGDSGDDQARP